MLNGDAGSCGGLCDALAGRLPVPGEQLVQLMALGSPDMMRSSTSDK